MNPRLVSWLIRLYPRAWRDRYGDELEAMLGEGIISFREFSDVCMSAVREHFEAMKGVIMEPSYVSFRWVATRPSAYLPIAMSVTALALVLAHVAIYGVVHEVDEGATAHIWQILMLSEMLAAVFFAVKWLPRATKHALVLLAIVAATTLANLAAVYFLT